MIYHRIPFPEYEHFRNHPDFAKESFRIKPGHADDRHKEACFIPEYIILETDEFLGEDTVVSMDDIKTDEIPSLIWINLVTSLTDITKRITTNNQLTRQQKIMEMTPLLLVAAYFINEKAKNPVILKRATIFAKKNGYSSITEFAVALSNYIPIKAMALDVVKMKGEINEKNK